MSETKQEDSKKDLALILARLSSLIEADNQQKTTAASRDFTVRHAKALSKNEASENDDADENYPELTDVADVDLAQQGVDEAMLNTLMKALKPVIDTAANRAVERMVLDTKQTLKQQLELEIRRALLTLLK